MNQVRYTKFTTNGFTFAEAINSPLKKEKSLKNSFLSGVRNGIETALAEEIAGNISSKLMWNYVNKFTRGLGLENVLRGNLLKNFPTIDRFRNGSAISIKSLDLNAKSYAKASDIKSTLKNYINQLADFNGAVHKYKGQIQSIAGEQIKSKHLWLIIPQSSTSIQRNVLKNQIAYAKSKGIKITLLRL